MRPLELQDFGDYTLLSRLARGGMGELFVAQQFATDCLPPPCVIKRIRPEHRGKPDFEAMFFREAELNAQLKHPNIVQILGMGRIDGHPYIRMELVEGKSLRELIDAVRDRGEPLPLPVILEIVLQLAEGLSYAHTATDAQGQPMEIVHRDVNPNNVLLSYEGGVKLIDFGIARSAMSEQDSVSGTIKGKFTYMSPEQSAAEPLDARSDLFSVGILLYELLTLTNPFVRDNTVLSLEAIQSEELPPPSSQRPEAAPFDAVVVRALEKEPEARYASAAELIEALRQISPALPSGEGLAAFLRARFPDDIPTETETDTYQGPYPYPPAGLTPWDPPTEAAPVQDEAPRGQRLLGYTLAFVLTLALGFFPTLWAVRHLAGDEAPPPPDTGAKPQKPAPPDPPAQPDTPKPKSPAATRTDTPSAPIQPTPQRTAPPSPAATPAEARTQPPAQASAQRSAKAEARRSSRPRRAASKTRSARSKQAQPKAGAASRPLIVSTSAPAPAPRFSTERPGSLVVSANRAASVSFGSQTRRLPTTLKLTKTTGKLSLHGPQLPYRARLRYTVGPRGVAVGVDATPWVNVRHNGVKAADPRTPQGPFPAAKRHRLTLQRPDSPSVVVTLRWRPDPS